VYWALGLYTPPPAAAADRYVASADATSSAHRRRWPWRVLTPPPTPNFTAWESTRNNRLFKQSFLVNYQHATLSLA